ncbi:MAG: hypothetical protein NTV72_01495 [Candidatus Taylorbacteria bacterium]|nr:hypothetical protein [Candidatus Taylorbacteria bacterium]
MIEPSTHSVILRESIRAVFYFLKRGYNRHSVIGYQILELSKNAFENSEKGGKVSVEVGDDEVKVIIMS